MEFHTECMYQVCSHPRTSFFESMLKPNVWLMDNKTNRCRHTYPDSNVHGANMGPTWVLSAPDGPHVGPMNLAIRIAIPIAPSKSIGAGQKLIYELPHCYSVLYILPHMYHECMWSGMIDGGEVTATVMNGEEGATYGRHVMYMINWGLSARLQ